MGGNIRTIIFPACGPPAMGFVCLCSTIVPAIAIVDTGEDAMREDLTLSGQKITPPDGGHDRTIP